MFCVFVCVGSSTDYEPVCGRPHGVRLDRGGQLIVADSYLGLHSVDPRTGAKTLLLASSQGKVWLLVEFPVNHKPARAFSSVSFLVLSFSQAPAAFPSPS